MSTNTNPAKKGRKPTVITWPVQPFTSAMLRQENPKLSKVSIQLRINKAVTEGLLIKNGTIKPKVGRPSVQYTLKTI